MTTVLWWLISGLARYRSLLVRELKETSRVWIHYDLFAKEQSAKIKATDKRIDDLLEMSISNTGALEVKGDDHMKKNDVQTQPATAISLEEAFRKCMDDAIADTAVQQKTPVTIIVNPRFCCEECVDIVGNDFHCPICGPYKSAKENHDLTDDLPPRCITCDAMTNRAPKHVRSAHLSMCIHAAIAYLAGEKALPKSDGWAGQDAPGLIAERRAGLRKMLALKKAVR